MSYGTTATINPHDAQYVEPLRFMPPYAAAIPDTYSSEIGDLSRLLDGELV